MLKFPARLPIIWSEEELKQLEANERFRARNSQNLSVRGRKTTNPLCGTMGPVNFSSFVVFHNWWQIVPPMTNPFYYEQDLGSVQTLKFPARLSNNIKQRRAKTTWGQWKIQGSQFTEHFCKREERWRSFRSTADPPCGTMGLVNVSSLVFFQNWWQISYHLP